MRGTQQNRPSPNGRGPAAQLWQEKYAAQGPPPPSVRGITGSARSWGRVAEELADVGLVLPALHSVVRRPRRTTAPAVPAVPEPSAVEYRAS
jgi:hypothetical protein